MAGLAITAFDPQLITSRGIQRVTRIRAVTDQAARGPADRAIPFDNDQLVKVFAIALKVKPKIDYNLHAHRIHAQARPEDRRQADHIGSGFAFFPNQVAVAARPVVVGPRFATLRAPPPPPRTGSTNHRGRGRKDTQVAKN